MKKLNLYLFIFLLFLGLPSSEAQAQFFGSSSPSYIHTDSLNVGTTVIDSTFSTQWEQVTFWCRGGDGEFRIATKSDTVGFTTRDLLRIPENMPIIVGAGTKLYRWAGKANSGSVTWYFLGSKRTKRGS